MERSMAMRRRWLGLALVLALALTAACGSTTRSGEQIDATTAREGRGAGVVPLEGWALSGQDRAGRAGQPTFYAFDAYG